MTVSNDNDMDILSTSQSDNSVRWHENNNEVFTQHLIHNLSNGGFFAVYADDFDNDGDMDVTAAANSDGSIWVYENQGSNSFTVFELLDPLFLFLFALSRLEKPVFFFYS